MQPEESPCRRSPHRGHHVLAKGTADEYSTPDMRTTISSIVLGATCVALSLAEPAPTRDGSADVQFRDAYTLVRLADGAYDRNELEKARSLYSDALETYGVLRRKFPDWQPGVVDYRIRYCMRRIELLPAPTQGETNAAVHARSVSDATPRPAPRPVPSDADLKASQALSALIDASRRHLLAGNAAPARESLLTALKISPDHPTIRLLLAFAQCQMGQFDDAVTLLDNLIEDEPRNAQAYLYRGAARIGLGLVDEAISDMQQAASLDPSSRDAHYNLAQTLLMKASPDLPVARQHYNKAVELGATPDAALEDRLKTAVRPR